MKGWRGRWERGSGRGTHVNPWLIHVNVWQKPLQYCKVISLQLIKINGKKNKSSHSKYKKKKKVTSANAVGGRKNEKVPGGRYPVEGQKIQITLLQRNFTPFTKATMNMLLRGAPP